MLSEAEAPGHMYSNGCSAADQILRGGSEWTFPDRINRPLPGGQAVDWRNEGRHERLLVPDQAGLQ